MKRQTKKRLTKKSISLFLILCIVFSMIPGTAFATVTENNPTGTGKKNITCEAHEQHDEDCGYEKAIPAVPCDHLNEDKTYSCEPEGSKKASPEEADDYICSHEDDCHYAAKVPGKDCSHSCELCEEDAAGNEGIQPALLLLGTSTYSFGGGDGSKDKPYIIKTEAHLRDLADAVNNDNTTTPVYADKYYRLDTDIELTQNWTPIGKNLSYNFKGNFNGNGFTISDLKIDSRFDDSRSDNQGLFGYLGKGGTIENLGIIDSSVKGHHFIGGLVGMSDGTVNGCYVTGEVSGNNSVGGIVGGSDYGKLLNCYSSATVEALGSPSGSIGGVAGFVRNATMESCYATGKVIGNDAERVGGLIGELTNAYRSKVTLCAALNPNVSGKADVGRVVGALGSNAKASGNYAFADMINTDGNTGWTDKEADKANGADADHDTINRSTWWKDTMKFSSPWEIEDRKLPGFEEALDPPQHLVNPIPKYTISGRVTDSSTLAGIAAAIQLKDENNNNVGNSVTAKANGDYTTPYVPAGKYHMEISCEGYQTATLSAQSSITISGSNIVGQDISLTATAPPKAYTISGNITDIETGKGIDAWLCIQGKGIDYTKQAAPDGSYTLEEVPAGTYSIEFTHRDYYVAYLKDIIVSDCNLTGQDIKLTKVLPFVPVADITGVAAAGTAETPILLSGTVMPENATNRDIRWEVKEPGTTGASISDNTLNTTAAGTVVVTANVPGGMLQSKTYKKDFTITISAKTAQNTSSGSSSDKKTPDRPNTPTPAQTVLESSISGRNATAAITDKTVADALDKAAAEAKKYGNTQNGISLVLHVNTGSRSVGSITVNLPKSVQETIINKQIVNTLMIVDNPDITINMDLATVAEINRQAQADVNITATLTDGSRISQNAREAIGTRPAFDLSVSYGSNAVQSFGTGNVVVAIPYVLGMSEDNGSIQAVYVDSAGNVQWLQNSVYDSANQMLRFKTNHSSTYGVGYHGNTPAFADTAAHWAEDDIRFVVNRGLLPGNGGTYNPDEAVNRDSFITALGRLANTDLSSILGKNAGTNQADTVLTREQMAVLMSDYARAIGFTAPKVHEENTFADSSKISAAARDAVKQMQMAGVISSKAGNQFDPQSTVTRAEAAAVLRRFISLTISSDAMHGFRRNDSGQWMYYENGSPVIGQKNIGGTVYTFDRNGTTADSVKNQ